MKSINLQYKIFFSCNNSDKSSILNVNSVLLKQNHHKNVRIKLTQYKIYTFSLKKTEPSKKYIMYYKLLLKANAGGGFMTDYMSNKYFFLVCNSQCWAFWMPQLYNGLWLKWKSIQNIFHHNINFHSTTLYIKVDNLHTSIFHLRVNCHDVL